MRLVLATLLAILLAGGAGSAQSVDPRLVDAEQAFEAGRSLWGSGLMPQIDLLLRRALRLQEEALGLDDLLVARTRDYLGRNAFNAGRFGEAEGLFRDAARIAVPRTGERTADVAYYFGSIAASLREQGRYGEAWPFVCRSLDIRRELQQGDTLIASSLDNMARIALGEGHAAEARSLHWIYLAAVGPNAPLVRNQAALLDQLRKLAPDAPRVDARDFCNTSRRNC